MTKVDFDYLNKHLKADSSSLSYFCTICEEKIGIGSILPTNTREKIVSHFSPHFIEKHDGTAETTS